MALLPKLRKLIKRPRSASTVGVRRPTSAPRKGDTVHEDALRAVLNDDPNNAEAFQALVEVVRRRAAEPSSEDPLTAPAPDVDVAAERKRRADLAEWALAEELAGHPKAWYPLIALARLSLQDDRQGAVRRLETAADRDPSGHALAEAIAMLRGANAPVEALGLGVGHWRAREHDPEVGRELVLAALDADRVYEAKHHLTSLDLSAKAHTHEVKKMRRELQGLIDDAEAQSPSA